MPQCGVMGERVTKFLVDFNRIYNVLILTAPGGGSVNWEEIE